MIKSNQNNLPGSNATPHDFRVQYLGSYRDGGIHSRVISVSADCDQLTLEKCWQFCRLCGYPYQQST